MSSDRKRKKFISELTEDDLYADEAPVRDEESAQAEPVVREEPRRKTFHSKHFADDDKPAEPQVKQKISHAEASGILISAVMTVYGLVTEDKPLFFLSSALMIFLLRPLIGGLFGEHNAAVQNALHAFSIALFVGALIFLFL